jgi:hypothetical protein
MSKIAIVLLFVAITLILLATYNDVAFLGRGGGFMLVIGLIYSYVVASRQAALLTLSREEQEAERRKARAKPAPQGVGIGTGRARTI